MGVALLPRPRSMNINVSPVTDHTLGDAQRSHRLLITSSIPLAKVTYVIRITDINQTASGGSYFVDLTAIYHRSDADDLLIQIADDFVRNMHDEVDPDEDIAALVLDTAVEAFSENPTQQGGVLCFSRTRIHPVDYRTFRMKLAIRALARLLHTGL